jgi:hypothetical protein
MAPLVIYGPDSSVSCDCDFLAKGKGTGGLGAVLRKEMLYARTWGILKVTNESNHTNIKTHAIWHEERGFMQSSPEQPGYVFQLLKVYPLNGSVDC